jgi:hypothetical protein
MLVSYNFHPFAYIFKVKTTKYPKAHDAHLTKFVCLYNEKEERKTTPMFPLA